VWCGSQAASLQNAIVTATLSSDTLAAIFSRGKEQHWEHAANISISSVEEALLKHAQCARLAQHIKFKSYDLSEEMLQTIAGKPNAIIVGADGSRSTVRAGFFRVQPPHTGQVTFSHINCSLCLP